MRVVPSTLFQCFQFLLEGRIYVIPSDPNLYEYCALNQTEYNTRKVNLISFIITYQKLATPHPQLI